VALGRDASEALDAGGWSPEARALLDGLLRAMLERSA